jgi:hypothetical protein
MNSSLILYIIIDINQKDGLPKKLGKHGFEKIDIGYLMSRGSIYFIAIWTFIGCLGMAINATYKFMQQTPAWMYPNSWDEQALGAIVNASIAIACLRYNYRRREVHSLNDNATKQEPWRARTELRVVLYVLAIIQFLSIPINVIKAYQATQDRSAPYQRKFWGHFRTESFVYTALGVAIIVYDRHRLRREDREGGTYCLKCGYDLRATPNRCPECGTIPGTEIKDPKWQW